MRLSLVPCFLRSPIRSMLEIKSSTQISLSSAYNSRWTAGHRLCLVGGFWPTYSHTGQQVGIWFYFELFSNIYTCFVSHSHYLRYPPDEIVDTEVYTEVYRNLNKKLKIFILPGIYPWQNKYCGNDHFGFRFLIPTRIDAVVKNAANLDRSKLAAFFIYLFIKDG